MTQYYINRLGYEIVGAAIEVHNSLGPGLLESVYEKCLAHDLLIRGYDVKRQIPVPGNYKGLEFTTEFRLDLIVNDVIIVELKAAETWNKVWEAQLLTYLKLMNLPKGLLINFFEPVLKDGMKSFVTEAYAKLPKE
ncbi:MAG: GxxExxY protein [Candidatus Kapaibacterium sp.]|nr:GxxExxY protein [Bacteroidota bacterium]